MRARIVRPFWCVCAVVIAGCAAVPAATVDPREAEIREVLGRPLAGSVVFKDAALEEVATRLSAASGVPVVIGPPLLDDFGRPLSTPANRVTADVTGLSLGRAVAAMKGADPYEGLGAIVRDGVVTISTRLQGDAGRLVCRTYDVADLIEQGATRDERGLTSAQLVGVCFGPTTGPTLDARARSAQALIDLVKSSVEPNSWAPEGDGSGRAREYAGRLVVFQTPENQDRVRIVLAQLRRPTKP